MKLRVPVALTWVIPTLLAGCGWWNDDRQPLEPVLCAVELTADTMSDADFEDLTVCDPSFEGPFAEGEALRIVYAVHPHVDDGTGAHLTIETPCDSVDEDVELSDGRLDVVRRAPMGASCSLRIEVTFRGGSESQLIVHEESCAVVDLCGE